MFERLRALFQRKEPTGTNADPPAHSLGVAQPLGQWLDASDPKNPFTVGGYDCLAFVQSMVSTTKDEDVAASFVALRTDLGRGHIGKTPDDAVELDCQLEYPLNGLLSDGALFKAQQMEDKWDIYIYQDRLYFCRSWTGDLLFVAQFLSTSDRFVIHALWAPRELTADDPRYPVRVLDYLVKSHVLLRRCPHPLPVELQQDASAIALFSFSQFGRHCCFGTYEETLVSDLRKHLPGAAGT